MPSLADHHSSSLVKLLLLGDAKSGKTTSLASLVAAGYNLRILDFDNLLDTLANRIRDTNPDQLRNVEFRSIRDAYKGTISGTVIDGKPKAWISSLAMLNHWKYDDVDLGVPGTWGANDILVIDSLSRWCDAAYDFHEAMAGPKSDGRAVYGNAQDDVERQLANLTSPSFGTNVIVICHGTFIDMPDGTRKIFPQGVGQKLSPKIPQYFPNYIQLTRKGDKRTFRTTSNNFIDLASSRAVPEDLSAETGLAEFFALLRGSAPPPASNDGLAAPSRPKAVNLVRR